MNARPSLIIAALLLATSVMQATTADARDRRRHHGHDGWHDRWENRRDARRAGIVVGAVASGVARSTAYDRANRNYQQCMQATAYQGYNPRTGYNAYGYGPNYQWCTQMRYEDERRARRSGRRAGAVAGSIAYGVVRD